MGRTRHGRRVVVIVARVNDGGTTGAQPPAPIRLVIVDDQLLFAEALATLLERDDAIDVVGTTASAAEAIELAQSSSADVVLMDMLMPGMTGVEATARLHELEPATRVIVFSAADGDEAEREALAAGAVAFIRKTADADAVAQVVREVAARRL